MIQASINIKIKLMKKKEVKKKEGNIVKDFLKSRFTREEQ